VGDLENKIMRSVYFHDNNGIALEASYWTLPIEELGFKPDDETLFADPEPVVAINELANGYLTDLPEITFASFN